MDVKDVDALAAGINHFSWIGAVTQISTSKDLLPLLIDKLEEKSVTGGDLKFAYECYREYGMVPALHYGHFSEFLPTQEGIPYHTKPPFHGDLEDRAIAIRELEMIAEGKADYHEMSGFSTWLGNIRSCMRLPCTTSRTTSRSRQSTCPSTCRTATALSVCRGMRLRMCLRWWRKERW